MSILLTTVNLLLSTPVFSGNLPFRNTFLSVCGSKQVDKTVTTSIEVTLKKMLVQPYHGIGSYETSRMVSADIEDVQHICLNEKPNKNKL